MARKHYAQQDEEHGRTTKRRRDAHGVLDAEAPPRLAVRADDRHCEHLQHHDDHSRHVRLRPAVGGLPEVDPECEGEIVRRKHGRRVRGERYGGPEPV